jgi:hypothetical protein
MHKFNHLYKLAVGAIVMAGVLTGCEKKSETANTGNTTSTAAVNTVCPIMGEPVTLKSPTVQFGTVTVGFCCDECVDKWAAWSDEQKTAFVNKNAGNPLEKLEGAGGTKTDG